MNTTIKKNNYLFEYESNSNSGSVIKDMNDIKILPELPKNTLKNKNKLCTIKNNKLNEIHDIDSDQGENKKANKLVINSNAEKAQFQKPYELKRYHDKNYTRNITAQVYNHYAHRSNSSNTIAIN